jgi:hypothetical protein
MEEHLTGEGVIARVQRRKLARQLEDVSIAGEPVEQHTAGGDGVFGGRPLPGRHITTVRAEPPIAGRPRRQMPVVRSLVPKDEALRPVLSQAIAASRAGRIRRVA